MSETLTADEVIALFGLKPHPEGGHYRETFRDALGHADRAHSTAILFLLKDGEVSRWHKVDAAEHWHFHGGAPLLLKIRDGDARREIRLGANWRAGELPHAIVPAHAVAKRAQSRCVDAGRLFRGAGLRFFGFRDWRRRIGNVEQSLSCPRSRAPVTIRTWQGNEPRALLGARSAGHDEPIEYKEPKHQSMNWPPLMVRVEPVIQPASSAARNVTQRATSSASPSRPTGICPTIDFITSSETPASRSVAT